MKRLFIVWKYIQYRFNAKTKHAIHSPFVYQFIIDVLEDKKEYYAFADIEMLRSVLEHTNEKITVEDFGAGSHTMQSRERKISDIARSSLISKKFGQLLFKIVNYYKCRTIVELGTSLGVSTLYLAKANNQARVITLEGSKNISEIAIQNFQKTQTQNIEILTGEFTLTLPLALLKNNTPDLIFIDGNHRFEPTLSYFHTCLNNASESTIFIFDDIHWSPEMEAAWAQMKHHPSITLSIDLFFKGILFLRKDFHKKQHFVLRF